MKLSLADRFCFALRFRLIQVAPLGGAGLGSLPDTPIITRERQMIETYFLHIKVFFLSIFLVYAKNVT
jgi:hypothetical protein